MAGFVPGRVEDYAPPWNVIRAKPCPSCGTNAWRQPNMAERVTGLICRNCEQVSDEPVRKPGGPGGGMAMNNPGYLKGLVVSSFETTYVCPVCGKSLEDMRCTDCGASYTKEQLGREHGHCICGAPNPHICVHGAASVSETYRRLKGNFQSGHSYQVTPGHWEECLCTLCMGKRVEWTRLVPADEAPRRRETFVLKPSDVAGMFGQGLKLVDVRYDHETDEVYFVLEGGGHKWRSGCAVHRVRGKPLPTAYVMAMREDR